MIMLSFISIVANRYADSLSFFAFSGQEVTSWHEVLVLDVAADDSATISCSPPSSQKFGRAPVCRKSDAVRPARKSTFRKTTAQLRTNNGGPRRNTSRRPVHLQRESTTAHNETPWT